MFPSFKDTSGPLFPCTKGTSLTLHEVDFVVGDATLVTMQETEDISVAGGGGGVIHVVPAWAWVLGL